MKKRFLSLVLTVGICVGICVSANADSMPESTRRTEITAQETELDFYQGLVEELSEIEIYDCSELTYDMLVNRDGKIIIEKIIGKVVSIDEDGRINGEVLNCSDDYYNYICYNCVEGVEVGNIILTYCIYNPDTSYEDDIISRFDYVIDNRTE